MIDPSIFCPKECGCSWSQWWVLNHRRNNKNIAHKISLRSRRMLYDMLKHPKAKVTVGYWANLEEHTK